MIMLAAGVVTVLFPCLKQPVVLGYIAAGVIIGPYTPPFQLIHDEETIQTLGELGVVFLMFSLGLEFSLRKLFKVGATAFVAALAGIVPDDVARLRGRPRLRLEFDGFAVPRRDARRSPRPRSSIKALDELGLKRESFAQLVFGILIVEDILAIAHARAAVGHRADRRQLSAGVAMSRSASCCFS